MSNPYKVGLTGGIGSGKSLVSEIFADLGVPVIDADKIVHELISPQSPLLDDIVLLFGNEIVDDSGNIDRDRIRKLIFSDSESRKKLEAILHPHVFDIIVKEIKGISAPYCILSIPLLIETNAEDMVDTVLVVDCPVSLQVERVTKRDGVSPEHVQKIIDTQVSRESRLAAADDVISNNGSISELREVVSELHKKYSSTAEIVNKIA